MHVSGAVQGHPKLLTDKCLLRINRGGQQPALTGRDHGIEFLSPSPAIGNRDPPPVCAMNAGRAGPRRAAVQRLQAGPCGPVPLAICGLPPQALRQSFNAANEKLLVAVAIGDIDPQYFQHGIWEVGIPSPGAKANLPKNLPVAEAQALKGGGCGDEVIEGPFIPITHQRVPDFLDARPVFGADCRLQVTEACPFLQGLVIGGGHFMK